MYKHEDGLISWDRRSLHILGSWGKCMLRERGFHRIPNQYLRYHLKEGCYWSQGLTLRGVWKFKWLGQANTWALLQKYLCYIFVPSLSSETEPQSYGPTQQHQRLDLTVSLLITEQFRLHPLLLVRAVQQVHNSSYTPWSLLNSSFQPCIAFSEISDNEYNSLYL